MERRGRVLLVGFQDQDNLGLGYLSSSLRLAGHDVRIESFGADPAPLLHVSREWAPDLIGFSMIFQFFAPDFAQVITALRAGGITAHFTMGGHYASFAPEAVFRLIPELDSVVRFEGERTIVELVGALVAGEAWRDIRGIAWRSDDAVHVTPPRDGTIDLDSLPWPERTYRAIHRHSLPTASLLASRGCLWNCSFCSIARFYEANGTKGRRRRDPVRVVDEMEYLVRERGIRIILFQDDDFLAGGPDARTWAVSVAREANTRRLNERMRFKISCRSDEVREEVLVPLIEAGLAHVYLGVEAGDADELKTLNKHLTSDVHFRAGEILRRLNLSFDFGFMLLEPWSTTSTVRNNLQFLREFCAGGYAAAGFGRTLPFAGTPIEQRLRAEGRLSGPALEAEYAFLDPRLNILWDFLTVAVCGENFAEIALSERMRGLLFEARLDFPDRPCDPSFLAAARALANASNMVLLNVAEEALDILDRRVIHEALDPALIRLARDSREENERIRGALNALWNMRPGAEAEALFRER